MKATRQAWGSKLKIVQADGKQIVDYNDDDYRDFWSGVGKEILNENEQAVLADLLKEKEGEPGGWFIDLGCGFGRNLPVYYHEKRRIVLVDYALNNLEAARHRYRTLDNIRYVAADAYSLPFREGLFDAGIAVRLLHHLDCPERFFERLLPIFRRDALLVLSYLNKRNLFRILKYGPHSLQVDHEQVSRGLYGTHPRYLDWLCRRHGLRVECERGTGFIHQLAHEFISFDAFVEKHGQRRAALQRTDRLASRLLGNCRLALYQFVRLAWGNPHSRERRVDTRSEDDTSLFRCPRCGRDLVRRGTPLACAGCGTAYPVIGGIFDFRLPP